MPNIIIAAQTAAATSDPIVLDNNRDYIPSSISAGGLAGAETATLQYYDGVAWWDYYQDGALQKVTPTESMLTIYAPGVWRVVKDITVGAVAVMLHSRAHP